MKKQIGLLFLLCLAGMQYKAQQGVKKYTDTVNRFELVYNDSLTPVVLSNNEDIKDQTDPFVIEVYVEKEAPVKVGGKAPLVAMDAIADDCYAFVKDIHTKEGATFKLFACTNGGGGHTYYNYIFQMEKTHRYVLLKFINVGCNACEDDKGNPIPYDETKSMKWMLDIVNSVKLK
ncbi:MAG TPA: hypothetical protein VNZ86_11285 [Bacteroidia bacterium]|jgi:hypothetical protein|nr:hypothetical protein [Bacteroidia bacterium]